MCSTDGTHNTGVVQTAGEDVWFRFDAVAGQTYQLETHQLTLEDTVMTLYQTMSTDDCSPASRDIHCVDTSAPLAENDDDERVTGRYESYI